MIRKLLKSLREYKKPTLLTIFCAAIEVVFEILIPLCMSDLLDFGIEGGKMSIVVKDGTWLIVLAALQLLTGVLQQFSVRKRQQDFPQICDRISMIMSRHFHFLT